jgi:two-component system, chemotaxis family, chemotaxis protein CheY
MRKDIMIVDDSPAMRLFIRRTVLIGGLDVGRFLEAGNGEEALALLRNDTVDVILTDFNMPVMDGEQFVRNLQRSDSLRRVPVIVVSTDSTRKRLLSLQSLGVYGYLCKPFTPERLARMLCDAVPGWEVRKTDGLCL